VHLDSQRCPQWSGQNTTAAGNSPTIEDMEAAAKELHDLQLADYEQDKIQLLNRQSASGGC